MKDDLRDFVTLRRYGGVDPLALTKLEVRSSGMVLTFPTYCDNNNLIP